MTRTDCLRCKPALQLLEDHTAPATLQVGDLLETVRNPTQNSGSIVRIALETGAREVITQGQNLTNPTGVIVGADGRVFVADPGQNGGTGVIVGVNVSTGAQTVIATGDLLVDPRAR